MRRHRALHWVFGGLAGLLGLIVVTLLVAFLTFQTGWGHGLLRAQIESRMNGMFVGGAKVGAVEGNPLSEIVLRDVVINGPDRKPAITAKRLNVKLPLLPLISHQLRVDKVVAHDVDVYVKQDARGELNLAHLTKPGPKSTWNVALPNVEVHRGHVSITRPQQEPVDLDQLEISVNAKLPFAGPMDASLALSGQWRQRKADVGISGIVHGDLQATSVRLLNAHVGDVAVAAAGVSIPKGRLAKPLSGIIAVHAPAAAVHQLVPSVELPADVSGAVSAVAEGRVTHLAVDGRMGDAFVRALVRADVQAKLASGFVFATDLDVGRLTRGKHEGHGNAFVTFDVDGAVKTELPTAHALITAWGSVPEAPAAHALIAIDTEGDRVRTAISATTGTGIRAAIAAAIRKRGSAIELERGDVIAKTSDIRRASANKAPLRGALVANLHAEGTLAPHVDLTVVGHGNGHRLRFQDLAADALAFRINAHHVPAHPIGTGRVELTDLSRGTMELGKLTVAAGNRPDGKLQVSVRSQPKQAPWLVDADALVTMGGDRTVVDLQRHFIRAAGGSIWRGRSGQLTIDPQRVVLRGLRSSSGDGHVAIDGSFVRAGRGKGNLDARLDAALELSNLSKAYKGHVEARVDVKRAAGQLAGNVSANATGVSLDPRSPITLDAQAKVEAKADKLVANVDLASAKAGSAKIAVDVDAPKNIADPRAWKKLRRDAIRSAELTLSRIDLEQLARAAGMQQPPIQGRIDGDIKLTASDATGEIDVRGIQTKQSKDLGAINAELKVDQDEHHELRTSLTARLEPTANAVAAKDVTRNGAARLYAVATFKSPEHLFDPGAWRGLGANAFRGATLRADRLAFQPGTLERLGIVSQLRGELAAGAEIEEGLRAVRFEVNLHELRGGLFAKPIAADISGVIDDKSTRALAHVRAQGVTLVQLTSNVPVTLDELRQNPAAAKTAKIAATARIDNVPATTLMNVIGTSQITGGTLDGTIAIAGTVDRPTVDAKLVAHDVTVPSEGAHPVQMVQKLTVTGTWDGARAEVAIDGTESQGGTLKIRAAGAPDQLDAVMASLQAQNLDVAPLVAFMPGPAGGLAGRMEANLSLKGANPRTAELAGTLRVANGRIPIAPGVGTLFQGDMRVNVSNHVFGMTLIGKLGRGDVKIVASAPLDGVTPKNGKADITLTKVQLIGTTEPILTGTINADIARVGDTWRSNVRIYKMTVNVPKEKGQKLSPAGKPPDLVYGGEKIHHGKHHGQDVPQGIVHENTGPADLKPSTQVEGTPPRRRMPTDPAVIAHVDIKNVFVESDEVRGLVGGKLTVSVAENKEVGIVGNIALSRGVLDLFNRRYQVDKAVLNFDGSVDPRLDVRITHDFPEVTTITEVRGRMSKPQLSLSSQPARYSQAELLGFLLGGEPGGDPDNAPSASERVAGAGASFIGNKVGGYVKKALPVDVDVLRYEAATSTSSAAVTVGTWITDTLFLAYRRHLEARPDENAGEGEVEYWLRRRLVLEGVAGDRGVSGADLLWRRRW